MLILANVPFVHADSVADANLRASDLIRQKILPLGIGDSFNAPGFKFFEKGKLVGLIAGAPKKDIPFTTLVHTVPDGFVGAPLQAELAALKLPSASADKTLLIFVENGHCPPCDHIVENVKAQLASVGWGSAKIFTVNIVWT
jgi:hypothetical protein